MSQVQFGVSLAPRIEDLDTIVKLATAADDAGLDLLAIQDHPYVAEFVDAFSLIGHLLSRTTRIRVFPDGQTCRCVRWRCSPRPPPRWICSAAGVSSSVSVAAQAWTRSRRWVALFGRARMPCLRWRRVSTPLAGK